MGTTYRVSYIATADVTPPSEKAVEELLHAINQSVSTYIESSTISTINASINTEEWHPVDAHFLKNFIRSRAIYEATSGAFNPALGPLINAWGFGSVRSEVLPDDATVQALLKVCSFDAFELKDSPPAVRKRIPGATLDFGGIAKGYGVDAIAELFDHAEVQNYLVEIAGEVRAKGHRLDGKPWQVGIEKPAQDALANREIETSVALKDSAMSTSGNYRNYQPAGGKTAGHILNPKTGYPIMNSLMSATVIAPDGMTADATATALIVLGLDDAMKFVETHEELSAFFLVMDDGGKVIERRSSRFPQ
jgi:thiamine biosynthesis lipoprotein